MSQKQISKLFNSLGISPNRKGYHFLLHLVTLAAEYKGQPFPCMKELYCQTAVHFNVPSNIVEYNVRTMVKGYWNQKDSRKIFSSITNYPVYDDLTVKEFVSVLAEYVSNNL